MQKLIFLKTKYLNNKLFSSFGISNNNIKKNLFFDKLVCYIKLKISILVLKNSYSS